MRNPFKRAARGDQPAPSLRDRLTDARGRLAAAKIKARQVVAVSRVILTSPPIVPKPVAPAVDRAALVNYATFLWHERRAVCAELYPHLGRRADQFVLGMNEAWRFFKVGSNDPRPRERVLPASTRAVKVLDLVGIDWRKDAAAGGVVPDREGRCLDTGARPDLPHGWPAPDAVLLQALDDLIRLDAAQAAMHEAGDRSRNGDEVPGYAELDEARDAALDRLAKERAESLTGLQVKARALLTKSVSGVMGPFDTIAESLARDLLGLGLSAVEPRPDPMFAALAECERLEAVCAAEYAKGNDGDSTPEQGAAAAAAVDHFRGVVLVTVPKTAEGCKALAAFVPGFVERWGKSLDYGLGSTLFSLIARSPLL